MELPPTCALQQLDDVSAAFHHVATQLQSRTAVLDKSLNLQSCLLRSLSQSYEMHTLTHVLESRQLASPALVPESESKALEHVFGQLEDIELVCQGVLALARLTASEFELDVMHGQHEPRHDKWQTRAAIFAASAARLSRLLEKLTFEPEADGGLKASARDCEEDEMDDGARYGREQQTERFYAEERDPIEQLKEQRQQPIDLYSAEREVEEDASRCLTEEEKREQWQRELAARREERERKKELDRLRREEAEKSLRFLAELQTALRGSETRDVRER